MHHHLFHMTKQDSQTIQMWIATVKHIAYQHGQTADLSMAIYPDEATRARAFAEAKARLDEDIILVLTSGLPSGYDMLIVNLDATPTERLTLDYVITHLLNEEL